MMACCGGHHKHTLLDSSLHHSLIVPHSPNPRSPVQTGMAPAVLATLLPFLHLDHRGFGRHPLPLGPRGAEEAADAAGAVAGGGAKRRKRYAQGGGKRNAIFG